MKWYHFLFLGLVVIPITLIAFILGRRQGDLASEVSLEMDVLEARADAKKWRARMEANAASEKVLKRHRERLERLDDENKKKADRLRSDPVALADFLVRVGRP